LKMYFGQFGPIRDCGIVYDFYGVSRRFAYCEFIKEDSVDSVLNHGQHLIDGQTVGVRPYCLRD